jgi:hypothetical protein
MSGSRLYSQHLAVGYVIPIPFLHDFDSGSTDTQACRTPVCTTARGRINAPSEQEHQA